MRGLGAILIILTVACSRSEAPLPVREPSVSAGPTLTSATPSWENARGAGVDFRAIGQEPGWLLDIYAQNHIVLDWNYGEQRAVFPLPEPSYPAEGVTHYETRAQQHTISVTIRRSPCADAMSGETFSATVEVVIDGGALRGCGRSV